MEPAGTIKSSSANTKCYGTALRSRMTINLKMYYRLTIFKSLNVKTGR